MPRSRVYTNQGYLELQWSLGGLICIESGRALEPIGAAGHETHFHQFTLKEADDLRAFAKSLRRAIRQAHKRKMNLLILIG